MGNSFTTTTATPPAGFDGMTLTAARLLVRTFARNAGDSTVYSDFDIDNAIQAACDDFIFVTKCTRRRDTLALVADTHACDASTITNFRAERLLSARIDSEADMTRPPESTLRAARLEDASTGKPTQLAFSTATDLEVYPTPDASYTLKLDWYAPLTVFTAGVVDGSGVTLNIPDDYLRGVLMYGAPAFLQHADPEHLYANGSYQKYVTFRDARRGGGGLGVRSFMRG